MDKTLLSKQDLQNLILSFFKLHRSFHRFFQTITTFAESIGQLDKLKSAYQQTLRKEKEDLLSILKNQAAYLEEIDAPRHLVAAKKNEIQAAKEIVTEIELKGTNIFFEQELTSLKEQVFQDSKDLSTNFAAESDFPYSMLFDRDDDNEKWKYDLIKT